MKLKLLLFPFLALLSACGSDLCEGKDFETSQGICVFTNGFDVDKDKISYVIDVTEDVVATHHPKKYSWGRLNDMYDIVSIAFEADLGDDKDGYTRYEYGPFVRDTFEVVLEHDEKNDCWHYAWILPHEMMHVYLLDVDGDDSHKKGWHVHPDFTTEENLNSMQFEIYKKLRCDVCGYGCE